MILLIQRRINCVFFREMNLNSIMILLILYRRNEALVVEIKFKFHYDSINSFVARSYQRQL